MKDLFKGMEMQCGLVSKLELTYKLRATFSFYLLPA